ncbi:MAG: type IV pilus inner membrane component PilO [Planctomycetota bacterium]|jgi:type IV pilus assembly protein PilO
MRFGLREIIFVIVLLAVPTVSLFYVFKPRNEEIREALDEIQVKQARLDRLAEVTAQIDDIGLAIEEGRELIRKIEEKLPTERDVEGVLTRVWQIAAKNRLAVKSVKSDKPTPAAHYRELPLKVVVEGNFDGFYQFLLELEKLPRITRVHHMELERTAARGPVAHADLPPGAVKASFTLSIYFEPSTDQV